MTSFFWIGMLCFEVEETRFSIFHCLYLYLYYLFDEDFLFLLARELIILCWKLREILSAEFQWKFFCHRKMFLQCLTMIRFYDTKDYPYFYVNCIPKKLEKSFLFPVFKIQKFIQDVIKNIGTSVNWKFLILNNIYFRKNFLFDFIIRIINKKYWLITDSIGYWMPLVER